MQSKLVYAAMHLNMLQITNQVPSYIYLDIPRWKFASYSNILYFLEPLPCDDREIVEYTRTRDVSRQRLDKHFPAATIRRATIVPQIMSTLLGPNILLRTLFSNTFSL
jgi:hypothetical protein